MTAIRGYYYNGKSSARSMVTLTRAQEYLRLQGDGVDIQHPIKSVTVSAKVGNVRRSLRFPDGALCEILSDTYLDQLLGGSDYFLQRFISRWERSIPLALLALVLTIGAIVGFIKFGVPLITKQVVKAIPFASEARLGKDSLAFLDKYAMEPSKLPSDKRNQVTALFQKMRSQLPEAQAYRLEFRSSDKIGANAFALPRRHHHRY